MDQLQASQIVNLDATVCCEKLDDARRLFNKRVLQISGGVLMYYSSIPKNFDPEKPSGLGNPKAGVYFSSISECKDNDDKLAQNLQDRILTVYFPKADILTASQIKKPRTRKKGLGKPTLINWVFMFEEKVVRDKWAEYFARMLFPQSEENAQIAIFCSLYKPQKLLTGQGMYSEYHEYNSQQSNQNIEDKALNEAQNGMKQRLNVFEQLKHDRLLLDERRRKEEEEERERQRLKQLEDQKVQAIQREEEEKKRREEELKQLRKEQERQMKIKVQTAWEFRYYQAVEDCLDATLDFDNSMRTGVKLVMLLEVFREQASKTVQEIILELLETRVERKSNMRDSVMGGRKNSRVVSLDERKSVQSKSLYQRKPNERKTKIGEQPQQKQSITDLQKGEHVFIRNNMLIKVACAGIQQRVLHFSTRTSFFKAVQNRFDEDSLFTFMEHSFLKTSVINKHKVRQLQQEFKSLNYLNDICMNIRRNEKNFRIKVPLSCVVEYMGFTALVLAKPPCLLDESSLAYGPSSLDGKYKTSGKLDKEVELLGRCLAIKPHGFVWNVTETQHKARKTLILAEEKKQVVQLSFFTEVHVGKFEEFEQLKSMLKVYSDEELDLFENRRQGIFYLHNTSDIVPPLLEEEYANMYEIIQQVKVSSDLDSQKEIAEESLKTYPAYKARPEFLQSYFQSGYDNRNSIMRQYNPDAYETISDAHSDQTQLAEMSKFYKKTFITEFVKKLDNMDLPVFDSHSLRIAMMMFGVGMRYLGEVAKCTSLPHIRSLLEIEMIARTMKNVFFSELADEIVRTKEESIPMKNQELKTSYQSQTDEDDNRPQRSSTLKRSSIIIPLIRLYQDRMQMEEYLDHIFRENLVDFLNLIFGQNGTLFWEQVVQKQVLSDFSYDIELQTRGISPGGLLHALIYNLKVDLDFEPMSIIFGTPYPNTHKQEVINNFRLKSFLAPKSYQNYFNESINQGRNTKNNATNPSTNRTAAVKMEIPRKSQNIFQQEDILGVRHDTYSYQLLDLEITKLCNRYAQFKNNNIELALKTLNVQLTLINGLTQTHSVNMLRAHIYNEMAALHLNQNDCRECILKISFALQNINPVMQPDINSEDFERRFLNNLLKQRIVPRPGVITSLLILLKCTVEFDQLNDYVLVLFDVLMFTLEFTYGPQHPAYAEVFSQMARLFVKKNRLDDAKEMFQSQIICLLQTVGQNHRLLAEAYLELANFLGKDQSIVHYEKAYLIFESIYGVNSQQCTDVAIKLAEVYSSCGRIWLSLQTCETALKNVRLHGSLKTILTLKCLRAENLSKMRQLKESKKEVEDFFKLACANWSQIIADDEFLQCEEILTECLRTYCNIYFGEVTKEHRNFLYQVFDQILENWARDDLLELIEEQDYQKRALMFVSNQIRQLLSVQGYFEKMMVNFIESTGADTNRFIFNFKKDSQNSVYAPFMGMQNFADAIEYYENMILTVGRDHMQIIFTRVMIS